MIVEGRAHTDQDPALLRTVELAREQERPPTPPAVLPPLTRGSERRIGPPADLAGLPSWTTRPCATSTSLGPMTAATRRPTGAGECFPIGGGDDTDFTPVELFLAAMAGCGAIDVGLITGKRARAESFDVRAEGHKIRDEQGNHMVGLTLTFDITFPEGRTATGHGSSCRARWSRPATDCARSAARSRSAAPSSTSSA